ncbi:antitoxin family protein [Chloroflexales bacterium ZM16-3]|nr:antitoxin family protein [Chloroflexales bacterium ZM16-3]
MTQTITAVYENGMLRPLTPLALPEHSQVEIEVRMITEDSAQARRERVRLALEFAGLLVLGEASGPLHGMLTSDQRMSLAQRLAAVGVPPLSAAIDADRDGR